jgi:hypothetical protein
MLLGMDDAKRQFRTVWAVARYAHVKFYYTGGAARVAVSLFLPDVDGAEHPDVPFVRRLFTLVQPDGKPLGRESRSPCKDVEGTWFTIGRLAACEWLAQRVNATSGVWIADKALWRSFEAVLNCAPSRQNSLSWDERYTMVKDFNRLRNLKLHLRDPYPLEAQIDSDGTKRYYDPFEDKIELVFTKPLKLPAAAKQAMNLRDAISRGDRLQKELNAERAAHTMTKTLLRDSKSIIERYTWAVESLNKRIKSIRAFKGLTPECRCAEICPLTEPLPSAMLPT